MLFYLATERLVDGNRFIRAKLIEHADFIGPRDRFKARAQVGGIVKGGNEYRKLSHAQNPFN